MGKTVNTRIKQKLDTLENWNSSDIILLQGELAVISVDETDIKLKIGDGINKLSDLTYVNDADISFLSSNTDEIQEDVNYLTTNKSKFKYVSVSESNLPAAPGIVGAATRHIVISSDAIYDTYVPAPTSEQTEESYEHKFLYPASSGTLAIEENITSKVNQLSSCLSTYFNGQTFDANTELNNSVSGMYATIGKLFELFGGTYIPPSAS